MATMIDKPGVYEIPAAEYHADPVANPSLSSSVAKVLAEKSPLHAYLKHPKLGGKVEFLTDRKINLGTVAHSALLEGNTSSVEIIDADNYRTKAARVERDLAFVDGKTPLLSKDWVSVQKMLAVAQDSGVNALLDGLPTEQTAVWEDDGAWCRARVDAFDPKNGIIYDFKTTGLPATPLGWAKNRIWEYAMQVGFYRHGWVELHGWPAPRFIWIVQETSAPYGVSRFEFDEYGYTYAFNWAYEAIGKWRECIRSGKWPSYPEGLFRIESPGWIVAAVESSE